jgi:integrase
MPKKPARFRFTKRQLDLLPPPDAGVNYCYDTDCRGLAISVGTSGRKSFVFYRKVRGRPLRRSLGPYPDMSVELARHRAMELNVEIARGLDPFGLGSGPKSPTLRQAFEKYYQEYSRVHKATHLEDRAHFFRHIDAKWHGLKLADKALDEITAGDIRKLHLALGNAGKRTTANRIIALVSSIFSQLRRWGDFGGANPCQGVRRFPEKSRERFITPAEMARFLRAVEVEPSEVARDFIMLALLTGARKGNVQSMRWADIDLERAVWRIPTTKNGQSQHVQLSSAAVVLLQRRLRSRLKEAPQANFVLPGPGKRGHLIEPKKAWKRILVRATAYGVIDVLRNTEGASSEEIQRALATTETDPQRILTSYQEPEFRLAAVDMRDLHIHDLRRTVGTWLASTGTSMAVIGKALNHKTLAATQVYARVWNEAVKDALQATTDAFLATRR